MTQPTAAVSSPQATASAHGACVARVNAWSRAGPPRAAPPRPLASIAPMTATPRTLPSWRVEEVTGPAPPAGADGMPETPALVAGGLTRPCPAPVSANATARTQYGVDGDMTSSTAA